MLNFRSLADALPIDKATWDEYFFGIALMVSTRADCTRRQFGCIAVSPDKRIVATGYNSPPPGELSAVQKYAESQRRQDLKCQLPLDREIIAIKRCELPNCCKAEGAPSNQGYDACNAVHAEQNCILQLGVNNHYEYVDLYIAGRNGLTGELLSAKTPCIMCSRFIKSANVRNIYSLEENGDKQTLKPSDLKTTA